MFDIKSHLPKVQQALDDLGYDFTRFNVGDFVGHIAACRQQPIFIREMELTPPLFGAWLPVEGADYIFLDPRIHPVQYLHTLIHELAHIILGHRGFDLVDIMGAEAAAALGIRPLSGHLRATGRSRDVLYPFGWVCVLICLIVLRLLNAPLALIACMGALLVWAPLQ